MYGEIDAVIERKLVERHGLPSWQDLNEVMIGHDGTWNLMGWKLAEISRACVYFGAYYRIDTPALNENDEPAPSIIQPRCIVLLLHGKNGNPVKAWIPGQFEDLIVLASIHLTLEERSGLYAQLRDFLPAIH